MMKRIKNVLISIRNAPFKCFLAIKSRHVCKKYHGIYLCGKTLHLVSNNSAININGIMKFNEKVFKTRSRTYEIGRIKIEENASLKCGEGVSFYAGSKLEVSRNATLVIGNNCFFNMNTTLYCRKEIIIGNDTYISQNVIIRDSDVHKIEGSVVSAPIKIGNHCWIGTNSIILKGVNIGDDCVIGAGSVVTHSVPPNSMVAGNPARVIKSEIKWEG